MNLKIFVGIPLMIAFLAFGTIVFMGLAKDGFVIAYGLFLTVYIGTILFKTRNAIENNIERTVAIIIAIMLLLSSVYFMNTVRLSNESRLEASYAAETMEKENAVIERQNTQYMQLMTYARFRLESERKKTASMEYQLKLEIAKKEMEKTSGMDIGTDIISPDNMITNISDYNDDYPEESEEYEDD